MVLDNHRAHYSNDLKEYVHSIGLSLLFLPPGTSHFNCIETVWAMVKKRWTARLLQAGVEKMNIDMKWMVEELSTICKMIPPSNLLNISMVHFADMKRFLDSV